MNAASTAVIEQPVSGEAIDFQSIRSSIGDISRHSALFFLSTVFALACNYFFKLFVARELGARLIGWNALGMGLYSIAKLTGQMGLPGTAVRFISAYRSTGEFEKLRGFFWRGLALGLLGAGIFAIPICLFRHRIAVSFFHEASLADYLPLYAALIPLGISNSFLGGALRGFSKASRPAVITNFVGLPLVIVLSTAGLLLGFSLYAYIIAQLAGELASIVLVGIELHKAGKGALDFRSGPLSPIDKTVRSFALSFMGVGLIDFAMNHADRLVIGYLLDAKRVGVYAIATSAGVLVPMVLQAVNSVFSPTISSLHAQGKLKLLSRLYQVLTKWTLGLTLPLVFVLIVFAAPFMSLFGPEFRGGWPVLVVIAAAEVIDCAVGSVGLLLMMSGNERLYIRTQAMLAPIVLTIKLVLIPWIGLMGAAIGSSVGIAATNLAFLWQVKRCLGMQPLNRGYLRLIVPAATTATAVLVSRLLAFKLGFPSAMSILLALILTYSVFVISSLYMLDSEERALARIAWERTRSFLRLSPSPA